MSAQPVALSNGAMRVLLLDIDDPSQLSRVMECLPFAVAKLALHVRHISVVTSPSGRGFHVVVTFREYLAPAIVVALQLVCGSDWRREIFNLVRVRRLSDAPAFWRMRWNVLYSESRREGNR